MRYLRLLLCVMLCCFLFIGCEQGEIIKEPSAYENAMADGKICIVLDAGHGIFDVGAINEENLGDITEADINFAITSLLNLLRLRVHYLLQEQVLQYLQVL